MGRDNAAQFAEWFKRRFPDADQQPSAFADLHGLSHSTVLTYLSGKVRPRRSNIAQLAGRLGVPFDELWTAAGHPPRVKPEQEHGNQKVRVVARHDQDEGDELEPPTIWDVLSVAAGAAQRLRNLQPGEYAALLAEVSGDDASVALITGLWSWANAFPERAMGAYQGRQIAEDGVRYEHGAAKADGTRGR
jgi:transcriptional regulator with XRE-family HTH domain